MSGILVAATDNGIGTPQIIGAVIGLLISLFLAYKWASNRRWPFFVLGFFCGLFWIAGGAMGPKSAA